ncbi:ankyrin [Neocallimastix sp. 'constans']
MDYENFKSTLLSQLNSNDSKCLKLIENNKEIIKNNFGNKPENHETVHIFVKELNDLIISTDGYLKTISDDSGKEEIVDFIDHDLKNEKSFLSIIKSDLIKKVLGHPLFEVVLKVFVSSYKFLEACKVGSMGIASSLPKSDVSPYLVDKSGRTALMYAAENSIDIVIERYFKDSKVLNVEDKNGETLLFYCARNPNFVKNDIVSNNPFGNGLIHHSDIDVNHVNHNGESVLVYCAKHDIIKPINKFLVSCTEIDPNIIDNDGKTAGMYLVENGHTYELLRLYTRKCNYDYINSKGESVMSILYQKLYTTKDIETYKMYVRTLNVLMKYQCNFNCPVDQDGNTAFMVPMIVKDDDTASFIAENYKQLDLSIKNKYGENGTSLCYKLNNYKHISNLKGTNSTMDFNYRDPKNQNTLLMISAINNPLAAKKLLEIKPDIINEVNAKNENALIIATKVNQANSIDLLLENGIDINHQDDLGNTALHYAMEMQEKVIVDKLMAKNPNVNIKNNMGKTALDYSHEASNNSNLMEIKNKYKNEICDYLTPYVNNYYPDYQLTKEFEKVNKEMYDRVNGISFNFFCSKWELLGLLNQSADSDNSNKENINISDSENNNNFLNRMGMFLFNNQIISEIMPRASYSIRVAIPTVFDRLEGPIVSFTGGANHDKEELISITNPSS